MRGMPHLPEQTQAKSLLCAPLCDKVSAPESPECAISLASTKRWNEFNETNRCWIDPVSLGPLPSMTNEVPAGVLTCEEWEKEQPQCCGRSAGVVHRRSAGIIHTQCGTAVHSFTYEESVEAFRDAAARDRGCAIAHWGLVMTEYHQLWEAYGRPSEWQHGADEIQRHASGSRERRAKRITWRHWTFSNRTRPARELPGDLLMEL